MKIAYLTIIKDEEKLILHNLRYYYNIGIKDFYIMFNNSNDATKKKVEEFQGEKADIFLKTYSDTSFEYLQPERFKMLSNDAYRNGCDWMLPVDADEIFVLKNNKTMAEFLRQFEPVDYGQINCKWIDYHPGTHETGNVFIDWTEKSHVSRKESKIIVKWNPEMKYGDGHHLLTSKGKKLSATDMCFCAHFPNRSYEQLKQKLKVIGYAFMLHFGSESTRVQVKHYREMLKRGDDFFHEKWNNILEYRKKNEKNFIHEPIDKNLFS